MSSPLASPRLPEAATSSSSSSAPLEFASMPPGSALVTDYGAGSLLSVRAADGFLEVSLPFGRAFLRPSAVVLFPGARVSTDFGRGRVEALDARPAALMCRVALLDCKLANGGVAVGVFNARAVGPRKASAGTTFEEAVEDADQTRLAGNRAFTLGAFPLAIAEYRRCELQLQEAGREVKGKLTDAQAELLREKFINAATNLCTAYNRDGREESLRSALEQADGVRGGPFFSTTRAPFDCAGG